MPNQLPKFIINGISPSQSIDIIKNFAIDSSNYVEVLDYQSGQYAAMLPIN
jgi:hypothetical protein